MRISLSEKWIHRVAAMPESGMGYHRVDVCLDNGQKYRGLMVFNSEEVEWPETLPQISTEDIVEITLASPS